MRFPSLLEKAHFLRADGISYLFLVLPAICRLTTKIPTNIWQMDNPSMKPERKS